MCRKMNVLLINVDSRMPNLALMKISAFHKALGDDVSFNNVDGPDIVYASVILTCLMDYSLEVRLIGNSKQQKNG